MATLIFIGVGAAVAILIGLVLVGLDEAESDKGYGDRWADRAVYGKADARRMTSVVNDRNEGR